MQPMDMFSVNEQFVHAPHRLGTFARLSDNWSSGRSEVFQVNDTEKIKTQYPELATYSGVLRIAVFGCLGHWFGRSGALAFSYMKELFPNLDLRIVGVNTVISDDVEGSTGRSDGSFNGTAVYERKLSKIKESYGLEFEYYFNSEDFFNWAGTNNEPIHGIYLAIPPEFHIPVTKECLKIPKALICCEKPMLIPAHFDLYSELTDDQKSRIFAIDHFPFSSPSMLLANEPSVQDAYDIIRNAYAISAGANETMLPDLKRIGLIVRAPICSDGINSGVGLDLFCHASSLIHRHLISQQNSFVLSNGRRIMTTASKAGSWKNINTPLITDQEFFRLDLPNLQDGVHEETAAILTYELSAEQNLGNSMVVTIQGGKGLGYDGHFFIASSDDGHVVMDLGTRDKHGPVLVIDDKKKKYGDTRRVFRFPLQRKGRYGFPIAEYLNRAVLNEMGKPNPSLTNYESQRMQLFGVSLTAKAKNAWINQRSDGGEYFTPYSVQENPKTWMEAPLKF